MEKQCQQLQQLKQSDRKFTFYLGNSQWLTTMPMLEAVLNFTRGEQKHADVMAEFKDLIKLMHTQFNDCFIDLRKWLQHWEENAQGKVLIFHDSKFKVIYFEGIYSMLHSAFNRLTSSTAGKLSHLILKEILPHKRNSNYRWRVRSELCPSFAPSLNINYGDGMMIWKIIESRLFEAEEFGSSIRPQWKNLIEWWQFTDIIRSFLVFLGQLIGDFAPQQSTQHHYQSDRQPMFDVAADGNDSMFE
jgi:hypothetical protein